MWNGFYPAVEVQQYFIGIDEMSKFIKIHLSSLPIMQEIARAYRLQTLHECATGKEKTSILRFVQNANYEPKLLELIFKNTSDNTTQAQDAALVLKKLHDYAHQREKKNFALNNNNAISAKDGRDGKLVYQIHQQIAEFLRDISQSIFHMDVAKKKQKIDFLSLILTFKKMQPRFPIKKCLQFSIEEYPDLYREISKNQNGTISMLLGEILQLDTESQGLQTLPNDIKNLIFDELTIKQLGILSRVSKKMQADVKAKKVSFDPSSSESLQEKKSKSIAYKVSKDSSKDKTLKDVFNHQSKLYKATKSNFPNIEKIISISESLDVFDLNKIISAGNPKLLKLYLEKHSSSKELLSKQQLDFVKVGVVLALRNSTFACLKIVLNHFDVRGDSFVTLLTNQNTVTVPLKIHGSVRYGKMTNLLHDIVVSSFSKTHALFGWFENVNVMFDEFTDILLEYAGQSIHVLVSSILTSFAEEIDFDYRHKIESSRSNYSQFIKTLVWKSNTLATLDFSSLYHVVFQYPNSAAVIVDEMINTVSRFNYKQIGAFLSKITMFCIVEMNKEKTQLPVGIIRFIEALIIPVGFKHDENYFHRAASFADNHGLNVMRFLKKTLANPVVVEQQINAQDKYGRTPLHWAIYFGNNDCVNFLLRHGARLDISSKHYGTPLEYTKKLYQRSDSYNILSTLKNAVLFAGSLMNRLLAESSKNENDNCVNKKTAASQSVGATLSKYRSELKCEKDVSEHPLNDNEVSSSLSGSL